MAAKSAADFAGVFREVVAESVRGLGKLKKELARDCGMRPDRFSHLQAGTRRPNRDEVLRIGRGLRLDKAATDRLLEAARFPPLSGDAGPAPDAISLADRLGEPERSVALAEIERDLALVRRAWEHYVDVQARNESRDWTAVSDHHLDGIELYWQLRAMAARFLGQFNLATAASDPHLNRVADAETRCEEGMEAAAVAGSKPFEVMLLTRLASVKRLRSDYETAGRLYERALAVIGAWEREDGTTDPGLDARRAWRVHWTARIQRMQGVLELFKGHPANALRKLEPSLKHFKRGGHRDELSQVCYGLGWAHGLRGDVEAAASWDRQGLDYAMEQSRIAGREDERSLLQGHLYLGGDYLDLNDFANARSHLELARALAQHRQLSQYHEVGRVDLLLGKLEMSEGDLDRAGGHLQAALAFFSGQDEQVLLATAHNAMGDFYLRRGSPYLQRAVDQYSRALLAARTSRPPNTYYECAALVNICRARIRGLPAAELAIGRDAPSSSGRQQDVDGLIDQARELGRAHRYLNHRARLCVVEAEWAEKRGDAASARRAAGTALHLAHNFSPHLLLEVRGDLGRMNLPEGLTDVPVTADDRP